MSDEVVEFLKSKGYRPYLDGHPIVHTTIESTMVRLCDDIANGKHRSFVALPKIGDSKEGSYQIYVI